MWKRCTVCGEKADAIDNNTPYCADHWFKYFTNEGGLYGKDERSSHLAIELEEMELSVEEFRQQIRELNDAVVNFQPPKPTRQTRAKTSSKVARNVSGWRRGLGQ